MMKKIGNDLEKEIIALYSNGYGTNKIAQVLNLHRSTIQKYLKINNIPLRKSSPRLLYNINYFSLYLPETCYWAGFIMADGNIRSDRATVGIHLNKKDIEHLFKFKKSINGEIKIKENIDNSVVLFINGKWFPEQLKEKFSIIPKKSLVATYPLQLPENLHQHFIRGIYDGDGGITIHKGNIPYVYFNGTRNIVENILTIIHRSIDIKLKSKNLFPPIQIINNGSMFSASYSGKNAAKILNWMYLNSTKETRLDRKFTLWEIIKLKYLEYL